MTQETMPWLITGAALVSIAILAAALRAHARWALERGRRRRRDTPA